MAQSIFFKSFEVSAPFMGINLLNFNADQLTGFHLNDILVLNRVSENLHENIVLIILKGDVSSTTVVGSKSLMEVESELNKTKAELDNTMSEQNKFKTEVAAKQKQLNETISKQEEELLALKLEKDRLKNQVIVLKSK